MLAEMEVNLLHDACVRHAAKQCFRNTFFWHRVSAVAG